MSQVEDQGALLLLAKQRAQRALQCPSGMFTSDVDLRPLALSLQWTVEQLENGSTVDVVPYREAIETLTARLNVAQQTRQALDRQVEQQNRELAALRDALDKLRPIAAEAEVLRRELADVRGVRETDPHELGLEGERFDADTQHSGTPESLQVVEGEGWPSEDAPQRQGDPA